MRLPPTCASSRIRSERPAFELHYPHMSERMREEAHVGGSRNAEDPNAPKDVPERGPSPQDR